MSPAVPWNKEECTTKAPGTGSSEQPHSVESRSMLAHRCAGGEVEDRGLKIEDRKHGITSQSSILDPPSSTSFDKGEGTPCRSLANIPTESSV